MGGGVSRPPAFVPETYGAQSAICMVSDLTDDHVGQRVFVTGFAAVSHDVMISPFAEKPGVAMQVSVWQHDDIYHTPDLFLFKGQDCIDFKLCSGASQVLVVGDQDWDLDLKLTHKAMNVMSKGIFMGRLNIVSGGKQMTRSDFEKVLRRQHAELFYSSFGKEIEEKMMENGYGTKGQGAFPLRDLGDVIEAQRFAFSQHAAISANGLTSSHGSRPRKAFEYELCVGDKVSVIGTLRRRDDGQLFIETGGKPGLLSTSAALYWGKHLKYVPPPKHVFTQSNVQGVTYMDRHRYSNGDGADADHQVEEQGR